MAAEGMSQPSLALASLSDGTMLSPFADGLVDQTRQRMCTHPRMGAAIPRQFGQDKNNRKKDMYQSLVLQHDVTRLGERPPGAPPQGTPVSAPRPTRSPASGSQGN